ncbi:hypothetical protein [Thiomicrorhabdus xiamenensis]|uniref:Phosphate-starvation-inducible E n=1 Tax=Thiomicrorhabdus xiamenensis TaxID=2739063 RepID=A0A7D4SP39_9GAMM|nr:hypothetical protein [Thiomicrorhabdus xiamenensis]QKI90141.1 hypothetical protein HQN79_11425 [Thiomicrorhabdus xiamenensis]
MPPKRSFSKLNHYLQNQAENTLSQSVTLLRLIFIIFMVIYLAACLVSISSKLFEFTVIQGILDFPSMKILLTDALFTLIVLAIVKALFIHNSFDYALTFLEIAFVVIIRKLILLDTVPEENWTLLILGVISTAFFVLIIYIHNLKRKWLLEKRIEDKDE